jgi:hypothetical protein
LEGKAVEALDLAQEEEELVEWVLHLSKYNIKKLKKK